MRRYFLIGLCTLCVGLMVGEGFAQSLNARTEALAGAGIGLIGSGQAIQYNPAGLAFMDGWEAHFTFVDREYNRREYIAGVAGNTGIGTFGLSAINYGYYSSDYTIFSGYGVMITDRLAVGATLRLFHSGEFRADDLNLDLGTYFVTGLRNTIVAAGMENVRRTGFGHVKLRAGLFFDLMSLLEPESLSHYLDLAVDVNDYINDDRGSWANLGIEYQYRYLLSSYALEIALRGGVQSIYGIGLSDTTWGVGLKFETEGGRGIRVDYAPLTSLAYPDHHIVSVAFIF